MKKQYVMYHCHSDYSLLDSCTNFKDYIDLAIRDGTPALSISEHGKPMNWTEKWGACKEAGIRYIHSVEIYLTETLEEKIRDNYHTVLMAKNMDGLRELNELVSRSCDERHFYYTNRISFDEFLSLSDNIISTSACLASPLNKLQDSHPMYNRLANKYDFFEIQPHNHPDQIEFNKKLFELSRETGTPLIVGTDTHSSSPYKAECRSILLRSKHKSYGDEDSFDLTYKTYDEIIESFKRQGALGDDVVREALDLTNVLYDMTEDIELDTSIKYPILYGSREADSVKFDETVEKKFKEKLDAGIIPENQREAFELAMVEEMRVFKKLKMDGFMLAMSEIISWCKEQGMAIGTARGSVGGSRIAYVTDIIDLNPETWHTVFSRFCNEDREEIGDIDIDVVESDRPQIFKYLTKRFGTEYAARVASFGTMQSKGVIDDVGRALGMSWDGGPNSNPWSLKNVAKIKQEFDSDPEGTKENYPELFYYYDGLIDTKISQSIHPAGMVLSPITLADNFGVFNKEGELCLMLDMENIHEYTGLAKFDFLILKTVQVIRDACGYIGCSYPKTHEIDWEDQAVWESMTKSPVAIFQFESPFAHDSLKKFKPHNIFDMSLVTACIRPTGASYRDELLARKIHKNPSPLIDDLLKNNLGYLVYQEDTIAFLQQICGLSGSTADNIRRAIGRKQKDRLDAAMPSILNGYCDKSTQPREIAEQEAKEFLQVIEDSASYQFGYNHSIAYCLLGYLCAYYRHYYPLEFLTSFLNNAANDEDIKNGTDYANRIGVKVTLPKWGISRSHYSYDIEERTIAKGLSSVKYMSKGLADELYAVAHEKQHLFFFDVLNDVDYGTSADSRQVEILIKIDFFSAFGNQRELLLMLDMYFKLFKRGKAKKIRREAVADIPLGRIVEKYAVGTTKNGEEAKFFTLTDIKSIMHEAEEQILSLKLDDLDLKLKIENFKEAMGYVGYISGKEEDRKKLYVKDIFPLKRKKDGKQFGYSVITKSIGSGKEARFTVFNRVFEKEPIKQGDIIYCDSFSRDGPYFTLTAYHMDW